MNTQNEHKYRSDKKTFTQKKNYDRFASASYNSLCTLTGLGFFPFPRYTFFGHGETFGEAKNFREECAGFFRAKCNYRLAYRLLFKFKFRSGARARDFNQRQSIGICQKRGPTRKLEKIADKGWKNTPFCVAYSVMYCARQWSPTCLRKDFQ